MEDIKQFKKTYDKLGMDESSFLPMSLRDLLKATPDSQGYEDYFFLRLFPMSERIPMYNNFLANQWASGYVPMMHYRNLNSKTCPSISKKLVSRIVGNIGIEGETDEQLDFIRKSMIGFSNAITRAVTFLIDRGESIITTDVIEEEDGNKILFNVYPLSRYQLFAEANGQLYEAFLFKEIFNENKSHFANYLLCEHRFYKVREGVKIPFVEMNVIRNTWTEQNMWTDEVKKKKLEEEDLPDFIKDYLGDTKINTPKEIKMFGVYRIKNTVVNKLAPYSDIGESQFIDSMGWAMSADTSMTYREIDKYIGRGRVAFGQMGIKNGLQQNRSARTDLDYTFLQAVKMDGGSLDGKVPFEPVQFSIRTDEWNMSFSYAEAKICLKCGLSVMDYDPTLANSMRTATEVDYMTDITANTIVEKRNLMKEPLNMMVNDIAKLLGYEASVFIQFDKSTILNATARKAMAKDLYGAGLMSMKTALKTIHPDWNDEEINVEMNTINNERDNAVAVGQFNQTFGV